MNLLHQGEDFYGLPVVTVSNGDLELDVLETAGPRIIRFRSRLAGEKNILAETPDQRISTPHGDYRVLGGHRLQTAPETLPSTYIPDNRPVQIHETAKGVNIASQVEPETGLSRAISVQFTEEQVPVTITHQIKNHGAQPLQLSAWSLTMLPPGGRIIMPLRFSNDKSQKVLPDRSLVFWPYSRLEAGNFSFSEKTAELNSSNDHTPFKFGGMAEWLAYEFDHLVFVKTIFVQNALPYPDRGCSVEAYANGNFVELESLSPLVLLEPGQYIEHIEKWQLITRHAFSTWFPGD